MQVYIIALVLAVIIIIISSVVDCGSPPNITNASPGTPTSTTYQGTVTYTCVSGYEVSTGVTTASATCMASGMWGPLPTCQRMLFCCIILIMIIFAYSAVNCGTPPSGTNASPGTPSPDTTLGGNVTYTCVSGYEVSNRIIMATAMATCMANRMWEPVLNCTGKS